jgi:hypothetical protein
MLMISYLSGERREPFDDLAAATRPTQRPGSHNDAVAVTLQPTQVTAAGAGLKDDEPFSR